jgi:Fic/DOC family
MKKKQSSDAWPEIVFSSSASRISQAIRRGVKSGKLTKIAPKIYTSNLKDTPEQIIKRHRYQILSQLFPKAVISHRSALEGGISSEGLVVLSYKYTRNILLPGLEIRLVKGPPADEDDTPFLDNLFIASRGRALLENMRPSRTRGKAAKTLLLSEIEERLDRMVRVYGIEELNRLRDQARGVAKRLNMKLEFSKLDKIVGALLGTRPEIYLQTEVGLSRAKGEPFDPYRVELFAALAAFLQQQDLPLYPRTALSAQSQIHEAFFEAYFSNYIEGTEFAIDEAEKIIFENRIIPNRTKDSHDILGTYQIISEKLVIPQTAAQFESLLLQRHARLMEARPDKGPGQFKNIINRAGSTVFVKPEEVRGTLSKGFSFYQQLKPGIARALFMMFVIAEVHPFIDGNGRIARIMMNGELDAANQCRIIIPTVYREDYLLALRRLSRQQDPGPYIKMLARAQQFTASIPFEEYPKALAWLQAANAFLEPNEGKLTF